MLILVVPADRASVQWLDDSTMSPVHLRVSGGACSTRLCGLEASKASKDELASSHSRLNLDMADRST